MKFHSMMKHRDSKLCNRGTHLACLAYPSEKWSSRDVSLSKPTNKTSIKIRVMSIKRRIMIKRRKKKRMHTRKITMRMNPVKVYHLSSRSSKKNLGQSLLMA